MNAVIYVLFIVWFPFIYFHLLSWSLCVVQMLCSNFLLLNLFWNSYGLSSSDYIASKHNELISWFNLWKLPMLFLYKMLYFNVMIYHLLIILMYFARCNEFISWFNSLNPISSSLANVLLYQILPYILWYKTFSYGVMQAEDHLHICLLMYSFCSLHSELQFLEKMLSYANSPLIPQLHWALYLLLLFSFQLF